MLVTRNQTVFVAATAAATQTSPGFKALGARSISLVATVAGATSPVAVLSIQGSNDGTNYADIATVSFSANSTKALSIADVSYVNVRFVYTYTSGTSGTLDASIGIVEAY